MSVLTQSPAWQQLVRQKAELSGRELTDVILSDPQRLNNNTIQVEGLRLNYALQFVTPQTIDLLVALAQQQKVEEIRAQMWNGEKINITEDRAVLHIALRQKSDAPITVDGRDIMLDVRAVRQKMVAFSTQVRGGIWKGVTGKSIKHVINIGIGGSDLGPRMVVHALEPCLTGPVVDFVANADASDLMSKLKNLDPAETLFVIVSKTFTTQETILNAHTARKWIINALGEKAIAQHFVAVSSNHTAVQDFGIHTDHIFPIWDWVGGRFSLWSAVGLSIMLAAGDKHFDALCDGAAAMDEHFRTAPLAQNMPVVLALLGIWQRNFLGAGALGILPYGERFAALPGYLQQLEMESNGKAVTRDGETADYPTSPILFGERGTVGQHSFHQWLHQGSEKIPVDFIGVVEDDMHCPKHYQAVLTNMTAQAGALAFGRSNASKPYDVYPGGRSSNLIVLDRLDPYHLGMLLALYEHKVFVQGIIWNINSFDQPGVELGKRMAKVLENPAAPEGRENTFVTDVLQWINAIPEK